MDSLKVIYDRNRKTVGDETFISLVLEGSKIEDVRLSLRRALTKLESIHGKVESIEFDADSNKLEIWSERPETDYEVRQRMLSELSPEDKVALQTLGDKYKILGIPA